MNEPIAEYPIDGSRMDRITWIYMRAWPEETERGTRPPPARKKRSAPT